MGLLYIRIGHLALDISIRRHAREMIHVFLHPKAAAFSPFLPPHPLFLGKPRQWGLSLLQETRQW